MDPLTLLTPAPIASLEAAIDQANRVAAIRHAIALAQAEHATLVETAEAELGLQVGLLEQEEQAILASLRAYSDAHRTELCGTTQSAALGVHQVQYRRSPGALECDADAVIEAILTDATVTDAQRRRWVKVKPALERKAILSDLRTSAAATLQRLGCQVVAPETWQLATL
jgi:phage host-nuclease inhibitor protein Gam